MFILREARHEPKNYRQRQNRLYNDYNVMTDKSGDRNEDTVMNVTGVAVSAGGIYAYFDLIAAKNQPFIGGSMVGNADDWNTRFNINIGYYF